MARRVWLAAIATIAATAWGGVARASGHELNAIGWFLQMALAVAAVLPWGISCALLFPKPSIRTFIWGVLIAAIATLMIVGSEMAPQWAYLSAALLPAAGHVFKRVRAELRAKPGGNAGSGDGGSAASG